MKRFIAVLIMSLGTFPLWADTITSGAIGLLQPATNTLDVNRSWGDKLNANFQMISSTIQNNINQVNTLLTATNPVTTSFNNFTSTVQTVIDSFKTQNSTSDTAFDTIRSSIVAVRQSTSAIETILSTRTVIFDDEGTALSGGQVNSINCVGSNISCTQSNSSITVTISGPASARVVYTVTIGTLGSINVDYASNTILGLNQALSDLGSSMMSTNTVPVSIFFKPGVYDMTGSSNGSGNLLFGVPHSSGVIFVLNDDSKTIVTNYGRISGINVDAGSRTFTNALINMKDNSEYDNFIIRGAQNQLNRDGSAVINTYQSTHTRVHDGLFKEYIGGAGSTYEGQNGAVRTEFSTDTYHYRLTFSSIAARSNTEALNPYRNVWVTVNSIGSRLEDSIFEGAKVLSVDFNIGGWNNMARRNKFYIGAGAERDGPNYGVITLDSDGTPAQGSSTMTWIDSNEFIFLSTGTGGGGSSCIRSRSIPTGIWAGILITNNVVSSIVRTNWYFYRQVGGTVFNAVLKDNTVYNMQFCFADAGTGTIWTSAGNTCDGVLQ